MPRFRPSFIWSLLVGLLGSACASGDGATPPITPPLTGEGANLRPVSVQFTQGSQDTDGTIPLVADMPAVANVLIASSRESVKEVPVVLRLYRGSTLLRADTTRTIGVLGTTVNPALPSAQFLIPAALVSDSLAWQVEVDPARTVADSNRSDNLLPVSPASLGIVHLPSLDVHFVPIALGAHGGVTGNITPANAEQYLAAVRAMLPTGALTYSIGTPLSVQASFGTAPAGGTIGFWQSIVADVDIARLVSTSKSSVWYGIVPVPDGFTSFTNGGYAYIPLDPTAIEGSTRTAVSLEFVPTFGLAFTPAAVAHELGHVFGRSHAGGCGAGSPLDAGYPFAPGTIGVAGHDVFSWATGKASLAQSQSVATGDVMSYCLPVWSSPYTWDGILRWRARSVPVVTRVARTPVTVISGSINAAGRVTLRPALDAIASLPPTDSIGDVTVELHDATGALTAVQRVQSSALGDADGERAFVALFPASASTGATAIVASYRGGGRTTLQARISDDIVSASVTASGMTQITSAAGNALMVRDAASGDLLGIGWHGRVVVPRGTGLNISVSNGVRSRRATVVPR
jgi:hypothetical protein